MPSDKTCPCYPCEILLTCLRQCTMVIPTFEPSPPAVVVVPEWTAIQILGCDGETVVSHVQLPKDVLTKVQAVLTDADR